MENIAPASFINLLILHLSEKIYVSVPSGLLPGLLLLYSPFSTFSYSFFSPDSVERGIKAGDLLFTYKSIFQDVRRAVDWVHSDGDLKRRTTQVSLLHLDHLVKIVRFNTTILYYQLEYGSLCEEGRAFAHGPFANPGVGRQTLYADQQRLYVHQRDHVLPV